MGKNRSRSDVRRTMLARFAKKIPLIVLAKVESSSRYKTKKNAIFTKAYFNAFVKFIEIISEEGQENLLRSLHLQYGTADWADNKCFGDIFKLDIDNLKLYPDDFYDFISIKFSKKKLKKFQDIFKNHLSNNTSELAKNSSLSIAEFKGYDIIENNIKFSYSLSKSKIAKIISTSKVYYECLKLMLSLGQGKWMSKELEKDLSDLIKLQYNPCECSSYIY